MEVNLSDNPESPAFWQLVHFAAPIIAGQECKVKRQNPTTKEANGETSVNLQGVAVVTIAEDRAGAELMATILHELAHAKLHARFMKKSDTENEPPGSDTNHRNRPDWEHEADIQALEWARYGNEYRDHDLPKDAGILLALIEKNTKGNENGHTRKTE